MNEDGFDLFAKRFADGGASAPTRRGVLRSGLTLGAAAVLSGVLGRGGVRASGWPAENGHSYHFRNQASINDPEIQQKAFDLEYDIEKIFRFVSDEIEYEPYAGVLRGAKGTLWTLAGNSADTSLLLAALLEEALVPVRFVIGAIDDVAVDALEAAVGADGGAARLSRAFAARSVEVEATPLALPSSDSEVDRGLQQVAVDNAKHQLAEGIATINEALRQASIDLPFSAPLFPESERTERVWVQAAIGEEWQDLDAVPASAIAGTRPAPPSDTFDSLPERMHHTVTFRLVAERIAGGQLTRSELMNHRLASKDLAGEQLLLVHQPPQNLQAAGLAIGNAVGGGMQFVPLLMVGQEIVLGAMLSFSTGQGASGALGSDIGNEGDTTAEWLEIDIETPAGTKTTVVREIFDRIGLERRASGGQPDTTTIPNLPLTDIGDGELGYLPLLATHGIAISSGMVPATLFQTDVSGPAMYANLALIGHAFTAARELMTPTVLADYGVRAYLHEPNVSAFIVNIEEFRGDGGTLRSQIDLLHRAYTPVIAKGMTPAIHPMVALGVYSHVIERAMVTPLTPLPPSFPPLSVDGVGVVFDIARNAGIPIRVLRAAAEAGSLTAGGEAKARIAAALSAGKIVVTPATSVQLNGASRTGWWEIDPTSGATVDVMDDGRGEAGYGLLIKAIAALAANPYLRVGACIAAVFFAASTLLNTAASVAAYKEGSTSGALNNLGSAAASYAEFAVAYVGCIV